MPIGTAIALGSLVANIGGQLVGDRDQANKDKELEKLLNERRSQVAGSRGDIGTYFDELLAANDKGFNLREQSAYDEFRQKSFDIQTVQDSTEVKSNFNDSGIVNATFDRKNNALAGGLENTLKGLGLQQDSSDLNIETNRTDRLSQLDTELFNIDTSKSQLDTSSLLGRLFG